MPEGFSAVDVVMGKAPAKSQVSGAIGASGVGEINGSSTHAGQ